MKKILLIGVLCLVGVLLAITFANFGGENKPDAALKKQDTALLPLTDKPPVLQDVWLLTTKNNLTFLDTPATSTPDQFIADSNGDYTNVEVVSVQMDDNYTFLSYRQIDNERDVSKGLFLVPAKTANARYMLLLDMTENRADTLFNIDDVIGSSTELATFDINEDNTIVRVTTSSVFDQGITPVTGTPITVFIDLKNQRYRNIGDPTLFRWTDEGYQYKHVDDQCVEERKKSFEPLVDPRCDRLIDKTPWVTYVH